MNSFNHYSLGSCDEWMFDTVAGIGADQPGFTHIIIRPRPGPGLSHATSSYDSIHGKIATDWTVIKKTFSLTVSIPVNTTATVDLPDGKQSPVGSGTYHFTCKVQ